MMDNDNQLPARAVLLDDGRVELTLSRPVKLNSEADPVDKLTFHEPTAGDLIDAGTSSNSGAQGLAILASVTGNNSPVGQKLLRLLPARDYLAAQRVVAYFFSDGQTTGQ